MLDDNRYLNVSDVFEKANAESDAQSWEEIVVESFDVDLPCQQDDLIPSVPQMHLVMAAQDIVNVSQDVNENLRKVDWELYASAKAASKQYQGEQEWSKPELVLTPSLPSKFVKKSRELSNSIDKAPNGKSPVEKIMATVMSNEGEFTTVNWNDNGHGISVGAFQANQKLGELPFLLVSMQRTNPQLFREIFGWQFDSLVRHEPEAVRQLNFTDAKHRHPNQLGVRLQESLEQPIFKLVQLGIMHEKVLQAKQVAACYGIDSEKGVALVADMINQLGLGNASCGARHYLRYALSQQSEIAKLKAIALHDYRGAGRIRRDNKILNDSKLSLDAKL